MVKKPGRCADGDWLELRSVLPEGWQEAARVSGAIRINKGPLADPEVLLRNVLGHVASGQSLRQTAGVARNAGLVDVSDVALLKRLSNCANWFEWIVGSLLDRPLKDLPNAPYRLRLVDATCVSKPANVGTDFRVHTAISLPDRSFTQVVLTDKHGAESLDRFPLDPGDIVVADRAYGLAGPIERVVDAHAHIVARVNISSLPLYRRDKSRINLLEEARQLQPETSRELEVCVRLPKGEWTFGRLCIHALSEDQALKAQRKVKRKKARKQERGTLAIEAARYVIIFTNLPSAMVTCEEVFAIYRMRWQIELAFKTLKQIAGLGKLPHKLDEPARAWILAKVICALLLQRLAARHEAFPP